MQIGRLADIVHAVYHAFLRVAEDAIARLPGWPLAVNQCPLLEYHSG
jgi:hypothetical protein